MNVHISEEARRFIADEVASGRYPSEDAVIDAALQRMQQLEPLPSSGRTLDNDPLWGMFRDEPELIDRIVQEAMRDRQTVPLRALAMNKALLDTDIFSEFLKGHDPKVQQNAAVYRQTIGPLSISVVTVMEMIKGLHKMNREPAIQALLARLAVEEILGFDIDTAEKAGRIHAELERTGQPIGWADVVIAAIALRHGLELVTGNTGHYLRIQLIGYPLVMCNWRV